MMRIIIILSSALLLGHIGYGNPSQIHTALAGAGNQIRVNWYSKKLNPKTWLEIDNARINATAEQYLKHHGWHYAAISHPLNWDTQYQYRICDSNYDEFNCTQHYNISTPPDSHGAFTAAIFADIGYLNSTARPRELPVNKFPENWSASYTRDALVAMRDQYALAIIAGDIGYCDDDYSEHFWEFGYEKIYGAFMDWMEPVFSEKPTHTVPGNHEVECNSPQCILYPHLGKPLSNFTAYNARFKMPSAESGGRASMWYSFDYGAAHFTMMNTETDFHGAGEEDWGELPIWSAGHFGAPDEYMRWLQADLESCWQQKHNNKNNNQSHNKNNNQTKKWCIAVGHRPLSFLPKIFTTLLEAYQIDLYISGHIHEYIRYKGTKPVKIVIGNAGNEETAFETYNASHPAKLEHHEAFKTKAMGFGLLHVNTTHIVWQAYESVTRKVIDTIVLE